MSFLEQNDDSQYTLTSEEFIEEYKDSFRLSVLLDSAAYIFVENVICLNSPKYVKLKPDGHYYLTTYAREHKEQCCLSRDEMSLHFALSMSSFSLDEVSFALNFSNGTSDEKEAITKQVTRMTQMMKEFPNTFGEALKYVMKYQDVRNEELAEYSMIGVETISRMRNRSDYEPKLKSVVAICIGLNLPPMVSNKLIELAGYSLRNTTDEHMFYSVLLAGSSSFTVGECNELLVENGYSALVK
ncbi:MAG: hypothetical protein SOV02_08920 [Streptococcus infantarius]|nr:hypothetical protein [Streptococcus infantarius]